MRATGVVYYFVEEPGVVTGRFRLLANFGSLHERSGKMLGYDLCVHVFRIMRV